VVGTGDQVRTEVSYFYHLRDDTVSEFWLLADLDFDYKAQTQRLSDIGTAAPAEDLFTRLLRNLLAPL
jgi:hypothetical protein